MKKNLYLLSFLFLTFYASSISAQIVINEIDPVTDQIEIKNLGPITVDVSTYQFCSFPEYNQLSTLTLVSGSLIMEAGDITVLSGHSMSFNDDEMGLYINTSWTLSTSILDYVEWGFHGHQRSTVAEAAGIWEDGDFIDAPGAGGTMAWNGVDDSPASWDSNAEPTWGEENFGGGCDAIGGTITATGALIVCVGDGIDDIVDLELAGAVGSNSTYLITDEALSILDITVDPSINFEGGDPGVCLIWHLSYEDDISGLEVEMNAGSLGGCYQLSNSIEVTRKMVEGSTVETADGETAITVIVGDGNADNITFNNNSASDESYLYIITDESDIILGSTNDVNDFESSGVGVCRVHGLSYSGTVLVGTDTPLADLTSDQCYELSSNFITVTKELFNGVASIQNNTLNVFPSQTNDFLTISGVDTSYNLDVYNLVGQKVIADQLVSNNQKLDVRELKEGIYIGILSSETNKLTFRFARTE